MTKYTFEIKNLLHLAYVWFQKPLSPAHFSLDILFRAVYSRAGAWLVTKKLDCVTEMDVRALPGDNSILLCLVVASKIYPGVWG